MTVPAAAAAAAKLAALLESAIDGIYDMDGSGVCTYVNPAGAAILGYAPEELVGKPIHPAIHHTRGDGEHFPQSECPIYICSTTGASARATADVFWRKDGTPVAVDYACAPLIVNGESSGAVVTFRDISTRIRAEAERRAAEERCRSLFEGLPVGLYRSSPGGEIQDANPTFLEIFEFNSADEFRGVSAISLYLRPEDRERWMADVADGRAIVDREVQFRLRSGRVIWARLSLHGVRDDTGAIRYFDGVIQEITAQKETELALAESRATMHEILDAAPDAFVSADESGRITAWNQAAVRTFGWSAEEAIGRSLSETIIPKQHREAHERGLRRFKESGRSRMVGGRHELTAVHRHGHEFPIEFGVTAIRRESLIFTSFLRDITERVQLEAHVRQSQKMEAIGSLAGGIAHDFNNLLTVIRVNAEWLHDGLADERKGDLDEVLRATDRAAELTQQLLAYGRKQFLAPRATNLNDVVQNIESMLRRLLPASTDIVVRTAPSIGTVNVDRGQMEQVITNLVINARDAVSSSGSITIETRAVTVAAGGETGWTVPPGAYVLLSVSDTGHGMSEEVRARAMEPFFTTKPEGAGTGLGLSVVYGIVKQSGGEIRILSTPGLGTTVEMLFPEVGAAEDADVTPSVTETPALRGGELILLVDDQPAIRKAARRMLEAEGYRVVEAEDGEHGLEIAGRLGRIDLLCTDLIMPKMGGRELAKELGRTAPGLRTLFMSGYSADAAFAPLGADTPNASLVIKPFTRQSLLSAVRACLDGA